MFNKEKNNSAKYGIADPIKIDYQMVEDQGI